MRKAILLGVVAVVFSITATPARADLDEKSVARVAKAKEANKGFEDYLGGDPNSQVAVYQVFGSKEAGIYLHYAIDLRSHLCFAVAFGGGVTQVSCKSLKKGTPVLAPLITWDD